MIAAVMATRFERPQREPLLELLRADGVRAYVIRDDGNHAPDWSLYRLWNQGVAMALEDGAEYICVLNDDVAILPKTLLQMASTLDARPDIGVVYPDVNQPLDSTMPANWGDITPTQGTWGAGAMTGFCFMFRADLDIPFDEGMFFWYGDDVFEEAVRAKGLLVARIDGLPIDHQANGSAVQVWDEMSPLMAHDRERWNTRTHYTVQQAVTA